MRASFYIKRVELNLLLYYTKFEMLKCHFQNLNERNLLMENYSDIIGKEESMYLINSAIVNN